jgi:hypothetical protein
VEFNKDPIDTIKEKGLFLRGYQMNIVANLSQLKQQPIPIQRAFGVDPLQCINF